MTPFKTLSLCLALSLLAACGEKEQPKEAPAEPQAQLPATLFVDTAPTGAVEVRDAKTSAKVGDSLVLRGTIGGRKKPFVKDRAVMVITDNRLAYCHPEEGCPTPWDYCCETKDTLMANTATIQVVDAQGAPLQLDLDGTQGIEALRQVVIQGKVRNAEGSLIIDADKIHVIAQ